MNSFAQQEAMNTMRANLKYIRDDQRVTEVVSSWSSCICCSWIKEETASVLLLTITSISAKAGGAQPDT